MHAHLYIIASILLHATGESGYSCKYLKGFEGNLYLQYGCKDIDECKNEFSFLWEA
ncbi:hypothetical protein BRARA_G02160 [Brassica rapa]|uniref:S-protein homolog n=1 Tax=Brassica campestris TaxID=3711 RepID=A0A397YNL6_BRACM|nr:hypothetical protein BRARA_G02160 [Brassica rapa]